MGHGSAPSLEGSFLWIKTLEFFFLFLFFFSFFAFLVLFVHFVYSFVLFTPLTLSVVPLFYQDLSPFSCSLTCKDADAHC